MLRQQPTDASLWGSFFELALAQLNAQDVPSFQLVLDKIKVLGDRHVEEWPAVALRDEYSRALYSNDNNILKTLSIIRECKLECFGQEINKEEFRDRTAALQQLPLSLDASPYPLVIIQNFYMSITAKIFDVLTIPDNVNSMSDTRNQVFAALKPVTGVYEYLYQLPYLLSDLSIEDRIKYADNLNGLKIALGGYGKTESHPKGEVEEYVFFITNILSRKLITLREALVAEESVLAKADDLLDLQYARDSVAQIDALLCRLNLILFPEIRTKLQEHIKINRISLNRHVKSGSIHNNKRLPVISGLISGDEFGDADKNALISSINVATELLFCYIDDCDFFFSVLQMLNKKNYNLLAAQQTLLCELRNIYFDVMLLKWHAASLMFDNLAVCCSFAELQLITRITAGYFYQLDPFAGEKFEDTLLSMDISQIDFYEIRSEGICSSMGMLLQLKFKIGLDKCVSEVNGLPKVDSQMRQVVFKSAVADVTALIERINKSHSLLPEYKQMGGQLITDFYLFILSHCHSDDDLNIVRTEAFERRVRDLSVSENTKKTADFITKFILRCQRESISKDSVGDKADVDVYSFEHEFQLDSYALCSGNLVALGTPKAVQMNAMLNAFFVYNASLVVSYIAGMGDAKQKYAASFLLQKIKIYYNTLYETTLAFVDAVSPQSLIYRPVRMIDTKASFIEATKNKHGKKKQKQPVSNQSKLPMVTQAKPQSEAEKMPRQYQPKLDDEFQKVLAFYQDRLGDLQTFYRNGLRHREAKLSFYALLGLTQCLPLIQDKAKSKSLFSTINNQSGDIIKRCKRELFPEVFEKLNEQLQKLIAAYDKAEIKEARSAVESTPKPTQKKAVVKLVKPVASPPATVAKEASNVQSKPLVQLNKPILKVNTSPVKSAVKAVPASSLSRQSLFADAVKAPVIVNLPPDAFHGLRERLPLDIQPSAAEQGIVDALIKNKMHPLIHGGAVTDTLFNIPYRDLDLLCFTTKQALHDLLESCSQSCNILSYEFNEWLNVAVIKFKPLAGQQNGEELEIAYIPAALNEIPGKLIELARNFGINFTLYFDPDKKTLVDPLKNLDNIITKHLLDISQEKFDVHACFISAPDRMLDCVYKVAKYRFHRVDIACSDELHRAIIKNKSLLTPNEGKKFSQSRFDKLFMYGHAGHSLNVLDMLCGQFYTIKALFPMLAGVDISIVAQASALVDKINFDIAANHAISLGGKFGNRKLMLSKDHLNKLRVIFLDALFFQAFLLSHDVNEFYNRPALLPSACRNFLKQSNFIFNPVVINAVVHCWQERVLPQPAVNLGAEYKPSKRMGGA